MKTVFLPGLIAGYQVMEWVNRNRVRIIRCKFKNVRDAEGAVVYYVEMGNK